jgi:CheY-like chemotaxis protein
MSAGDKTILLVEDDRFLRRACEASLRKQGLVVETATDGDEALRRVVELHPDLILLDLLMPKVSGLVALRTLKADEKTRDIPVLILSNSSREEDMREVMDLGALDYWIKANLSLKDLGARVAKLLEV